MTAMYLDPADYPFTAVLKRNWRAIRAEFERIAPANFMAWHERELYGDGWDVFGLWAPSPALPIRFLSTALAWGIVAGLWLAWHGDAVALSRAKLLTEPEPTRSNPTFSSTRPDAGLSSKWLDATQVLDS